MIAKLRSGLVNTFLKTAKWPIGFLYSREPAIMAALKDFLFDHVGHTLIVDNDEALCDYEEIEPEGGVHA